MDEGGVSPPRPVKGARAARRPLCAYGLHGCRKEYREVPEGVSWTGRSGLLAEVRSNVFREESGCELHVFRCCLAWLRRCFFASSGVRRWKARSHPSWWGPRVRRDVGGWKACRGLMERTGRLVRVASGAFRVFLGRLGCRDRRVGREFLASRASRGLGVVLARRDFREKLGRQGREVCRVLRDFRESRGTAGFRAFRASAAFRASRGRPAVPTAIRSTRGRSWPRSRPCGWPSRPWKRGWRRSRSLDQSLSRIQATARSLPRMGVPVGSSCGRGT